MLKKEEPFNNLKKEMENRIFEESYKKIIGSIVYCPTQQELNHEITKSILETIDIGRKEDNKKETLLDALTKIIKTHHIDDNKPEVNSKLKYIECVSHLKIDTDLYHYDVGEIDYEENIYLKKHKQCSPIKRNSTEIKKGFYKSENQETWL